MGFLKKIFAKQEVKTQNETKPKKSRKPRENTSNR